MLSAFCAGLLASFGESSAFARSHVSVGLRLRGERWVRLLPGRLIHVSTALLQATGNFLLQKQRTLIVIILQDPRAGTTTR